MKDPVRIFGCGRGFHLLSSSSAWRGRSRASHAIGLSDHRVAQERLQPPGVALPQRCAMPVWMEILVNVIGYAGFIAIATFHKSSEEVDRSITPTDRR